MAEKQDKTEEDYLTANDFLNGGDNVQKAAAKELMGIIERVERLQEEKADIATDIKEVLLEAQSKGYDKKILNEVIKRRKQDPASREEHDLMLKMYEDRLLGKMLYG